MQTDELTIDCECGKVLSVSPASAGGSVGCGCGRVLAVPTLSELRRRAGLVPIPQNAVERVRNLINSGKLPDNKLCPFTNLPADTMIWLRVDCESKWVRGNEPLSAHWKLFYILIFGWIGAIFALLRNSKPIEEFGREVYVDIPLMVNGETIGKLRKLKSQSKWRSAIMCSSLYADLLREFPSLHISIKRVA